MFGRRAFAALPLLLLLLMASAAGADQTADGLATSDEDGSPPPPVAASAEAASDAPVVEAAPKPRSAKAKGTAKAGKAAASSKKSKRRKKSAKPPSSSKAVLGAVGGTLSGIKERLAAFQGEVKQRYRDQMQLVEEQAELTRLERARREALMRERLAELRAEAAARAEAEGAGGELPPGEAPDADDAVELTLSERAALIGSLVGSPGGIVGVVLGGAAGGAMGMVAEKAERFGTTVRQSYEERVTAEREAAEQQEAVVEQLVACTDVTLEDNGEDAATVAACRDDLMRFLELPANRRCADCNVRLTCAQDCWASVNLGVLVCVRCAALHRGLGASNSRIKSLVFDRWDVPMAQALMEVGNERARELYLARLPASVKPPGPKADEERLRAWVRNKYVKLKWAEPQWRDSLTASRLRASKVAGATTRRHKVGGKMPSLSSEG